MQPLPCTKAHTKSCPLRCLATALSAQPAPGGSRGRVRRQPRQGVQHRQQTQHGSQHPPPTQHSEEPLEWQSSGSKDREGPRRRAGVSPAGDLPSASQRQGASRHQSTDTADAWGEVQQPESVNSSRRAHQPVLQFDDLQWDLDAQDGATSWQQPDSASGQAASQRGDRHLSRRNGTERTAPPSGNRLAPSRTSGDHSTNRQQQMGDSRDRKRFLTHQEIVQVRIQSNQRLLAALDLFEERVAADGQSAASAQRSLQDFLGQVESVVTENEQYVDAVNVSTALQQLAAATAGVPPTPATLPAARRLLDQLVDMALRIPHMFKIGPVNTAVSSFAKMTALGGGGPLPQPGSESAERLELLLETLAERALQRFREPPPAEPHVLAILMWGYSRLGINPLGGRLFEAVTAAATPLLGQFSSQNVANLMIAAATLRQPLPEPFLEAVAQRAVLTMPQATPQGVGNLLWAFARLAKESPLKGDLMRSGLNRAAEDSQNFRFQNVANTLWAAAAVGHRINPRTLDSLAAAALRDVRNAPPLTVANLLTSCAKLGASPLEDRLVIAAVEQADRCLAHMHAQALSNSLWALATLDLSLPGPLLERLDGPWAERALALLAEETEFGEHWAQHNANILWAYARLRLDPLQGRLFQEVLARLDGRTEHFSVQNLSNLLLSAAVLQRRCISPAALNDAVAAIAGRGNRQEVCNTLWALAALGVLNGAAMNSLLQRLSQLGNACQLSRAEAQQLLMADMAVRSTDKQQSHDSALPDELAAAAQAEIRQTPLEATISEFHQEVSSSLESMGIPHAIEFSSPDGLLSIDIVARCGDGSPLAIEVDGDRHFTALPPFRPLGNTVLRNRLLRASGFHGLGIPFYDWSKLGTPEQRTTYLNARLSKWGIAAERESDA